jgi:hypothetical protein
MVVVVVMRQPSRILGGVLLVMVSVPLTEVSLGSERHGAEVAVGEERFRQGNRRTVRPFHSPTSAVVAFLEHVVKGGVQRPEVALAFSSPLPRHLPPTHNVQLLNYLYK